MSQSKLTLISATILLSLSILLVMGRLLFGRKKAMSYEEGGLKMSYVVWFSGVFFCGAIVLAKMVFLLREGLDNIYKIEIGNVFIQGCRLSLLYIGLSLIWILLWYFVVQSLVVLVAGKRNADQEFQNDSIAYFLLKGILLLGFVVCVMPIFEEVLRHFIPSIDLQFYH